MVQVGSAARERERLISLGHSAARAVGYVLMGSSLAKVAHSLAQPHLPFCGPLFQKLARLENKPTMTLI